MRYHSQRVAYPYFVVAMLLFGLQLVFGLLAAAKYLGPDPLLNVMPFDVTKVIHTNLLLVWLLTGFMGATYYLVPEESRVELYSVRLAYLQLVLWTATGVACVIGYLFGWTAGNKLLEQPFPLKIMIVIVMLMFLYNIFMTIRASGRLTTTEGVLVAGLAFSALLYLPALFEFDNYTVTVFYRWWTVHLWVEGVWEMIQGGLLAYLLVRLSGVDREVMERWLYVIVGLTFISGILGTGHHYYWIGAPAYWQWIGSVFSTLEVLPLFAMVAFVFMMVWKGGREHPNRAALLWALGCAVTAFFGAGVWGFMHTLSFVNFYTHGTQITAAHGHHAYYGAYVCLNLAMFTYMMPHLRGLTKPHNQILNMWSFWLMTSAIFFMTFTLTFAGVVQVHLQRVMGMSYMAVQEQLDLFYWMRLGAGVVVMIGAFLFIYATLGPARREAPAHIERVPEVTQGETV
jgi:nitric oxide reductase subunit B